MSGVKSDEAAIWLAAVTASVNFMFTLLGLYLVEKIGRRSLTLGSLLGIKLIDWPFYIWNEMVFSKRRFGVPCLQRKKRVLYF